MTETTIPGMRANEQIITDNCRRVHGGGLLAFDVAVRRIRKEYETILLSRQSLGQSEGVTYRLLLTVETVEAKS